MTEISGISVIMNNIQVKAIDLFSGCGGVSCGLTHTGFEVVAAVEIDPAAVRTYKNYHKFSNVNMIEKDICELTGQDILTAGGIGKNDLYLLAGCPPCQNFSFQNRENKNKSEDERKKLLFQFQKIILEMLPPFVLMENVPGIVSKSKKVDENDIPQVSNKEILDAFISGLSNDSRPENERYYVISDVLNAANYGVPQLRKRYVLHAVRIDIYKILKEKGIIFELPKPSHNENGDNGLEKWSTVRDVIEDLPPIEQGKIYTDPKKKIHNHRCARLSDINLKRMELIRNNGGLRTCLPEDLILDCHKKTREDGTVYNGHKDVYGIMEYDKPSPTITGGCLCYTKGRFGHPTQNRAISVREAARLQTFPDDFIFEDLVTSAGLQIGNAVPVKLVEASGREFTRYFNALNEKC